MPKMQFIGPMSNKWCYIGGRMAASFVHEKKLDTWLLVNAT